MRQSAVGLVLLVAGCSSAGSGPGPMDTRGWRLGSNHAEYTVARDTAPTHVLIRGSWDFELKADSSISGTWSAHWVVPDTLAQVGPQVGSGTLAGRLQDDGTLAIDLNPQLVDNNVWVHVGSAPGPQDATWEWSTIAGSWTRGPFHLDPLVF